MRLPTVLVACVAACGRISFDPLGSAPSDATPSDGNNPVDAPDGGPRTCLTSPAYTTMGAIRYREGVPLVSWGAARADCQSEGAELWVPTSTVLINTWTGDWVGITDDANEGAWTTVYGTPATFLPWDVAQPDGGGQENCVRTSNSGFEDRDCNDTRDYVCECK